MSRLLGVAVIFILMFAGWMGAAAFLLFAPVRAGNLIHDSFGLFPEVHRNDHGKKILLRLAGLGLLGFAVHFALRVAGLFGSKQL
jgi:hypothetical protein